jgi:hypothetical protein
MMLTRRNAPMRAITAGAVMYTRTGFAKASQPATPINFDVPENACDCHTHIHADPQQFPFFPGRIYTPELASPEEMSALHRALKIKRVVIVTPSVYGTDNSATLFGMKARGLDARGVAVIDEGRARAISMRWAAPACVASGSISRPAAVTTPASDVSASRPPWTG